MQRTPRLTVDAPGNETLAVAVIVGIVAAVAVGAIWLAQQAVRMAHRRGGPAVARQAPDDRGGAPPARPPAAGRDDRDEPAEPEPAEPAEPEPAEPVEETPPPVAPPVAPPEDPPAGPDDVDAPPARDPLDDLLGDDLPDRVSATAIKRVMRGAAGRLRACRGDGEVKLTVVVEPDGSVDKVTVSGDVDDDTGACLARAVRAQRFPASRQGVTFRYPVLLR
ncbi:MAG: hypothetical protein H6708_18530 [Kofleriaceae bacterium]|nr:hypothetical protein [Kofleriaceae bacterium]